MDSNLLNVPPAQTLLGTDVIMPFMFVADEACPLHTHLMKPYPFIKHLDHEQHVTVTDYREQDMFFENVLGIETDANRW